MIFLGIGIGLLYLVFKDQDFNQLWLDIKQANYTWVFVSVLMGYAAIISRGVRWNILLKPMGYTPKTWNSIHAVAIGYFANLAIPRIGEVTRCSALNQAEKIPVDKLFGTVLLERVLDSVLLLVLLVTTFLIKIDLFTEFLAKAFPGDVHPSKGLTVWHYLAIFTLLLLTTLIWIYRKRLAKISFVNKIKQFLLGIAEGFKTIRKIEKKGWFIFHTLFIWSMYLLMTYVCFMAFVGTSHLNLGDGVFITIVGGLGMVAPAPGGLGAYHAAVIAGLTALEVDGNLARSFAVVIHSAQTVMMVIGGLFALLALSFNRKKAARDLEKLA